MARSFLKVRCKSHTKHCRNKLQQTPVSAQTATGETLVEVESNKPQIDMYCHETIVQTPEGLVLTTVEFLPEVENATPVVMVTYHPSEEEDDMFGPFPRLPDLVEESDLIWPSSPEPEDEFNHQTSIDPDEKMALPWEEDTPPLPFEEDIMSLAVW
jgi:hypothetical protein